MKIHIENYGSFDTGALHKPFTVNGIPIGFISNVNSERVEVEIWDKFYFVGSLGRSMNGIVDVSEIGFVVKN